MKCAIYACENVKLCSKMCLTVPKWQCISVKIFVVENNTVQVYIEQESCYLLLYWSMRETWNIISKRSTLKIKLLLQLQKMAARVGNIFSAAADQHGKSFCPQIQSGFHLETHKLCLLVQQIWFPMSRKVDSSWLLVWIFAVHANGRSVTRFSWLFTVTGLAWLKHKLRVHD